jgi:threonine dehydratase
MAADARRSWQDGRIHWLEQVPDTIADGLRPLHIGERNLAIMRRYVAEMTTVSEAAIVKAFGYIWDRLKLIVEPSSAVAFAPLLRGKAQWRGKRIGVILSGGNLDRSNPILSRFQIST